MSLPDRAPTRFRLVAALAGLLLVLGVSPAAAADPPLGLITKVRLDESNLFEWDAPFSLLRWFIFVVGLGIVWFFAFNILMLRSLDPENPKPPRPKEAFARSAGLFVLFAAITFVLVFAVLSNDLYHRPWVKWFPNPLTPLNHHLPWVSVLLLGVGLMFVVRYIFRR